MPALLQVAYGGSAGMLDEEQLELLDAHLQETLYLSAKRIEAEIRFGR